jgi:hypothetical protein
MMGRYRLARPTARMWQHMRRATGFWNRSPPRIAEVRVSEAVSLNAGRCSVSGKTVAVTTDPNSGGYSALIPVFPSVLIPKFL